MRRFRPGHGDATTGGRIVAGAVCEGPDSLGRCVMANLREEIASAMKNALKAKDQAALATMRLISAALKDRDIAARGNGNQDGIGDDEILSMMQTMICLLYTSPSPRD